MVVPLGARGFPSSGETIVEDWFVEVWACCYDWYLNQPLILEIIEMNAGYLLCVDKVLCLRLGQSFLLKAGVSGCSALEVFAVQLDVLI